MDNKQQDKTLAPPKVNEARRRLTHGRLGGARSAGHARQPSGSGPIAAQLHALGAYFRFCIAESRWHDLFFAGQTANILCGWPDNLAYRVRTTACSRVQG